MIICNKNNLKVLFILVLFFVNLMHAKENTETNKEIKYFLDTSLFIQDGITTIHKSFRNELDKDLNPLNNSELSLALKSFKKVPLEQYYKVYYQNNTPRRAELIRTTGYTYIDGIIYRDKNATEVNLGLVSRFDNKGRELYSYTIESGEKCMTFYGIQHTERSCTLDKDVSTVKSYYENNKSKITIYYENNVLFKYTNSVATCDKEGKRINHSLDHMQKIYERNVDTFTNSKKKFFQNMIKEEKEKIKNIPDLNLTLEQKYIDKIDRLNGK